MGCCQNNGKIITPPIHPRPSQLVQLKSKLLAIVQSQVEVFETSIQQKITTNKPKNSIEFIDLINKSIKKSIKNYEESTNNSNALLSHMNQIKFFKFYLISKCKSKEGFYRNQNNYFSFKYIFNLIRFLLTKIKNEGLSKESSLEMYSKMAKGTYMIKGLDHFNTLLTLEDREKEMLLQKIEKNEMEKLSLEKSQLIGEAEKSWQEVDAEELNDQNSMLRVQGMGKASKSTENLSKDFLKIFRSSSGEF